jgi:hypothetical protein
MNNSGFVEFGPVVVEKNALMRELEEGWDAID